MKTYFVYMMTNKGCSTLYTGMTNSLVHRVSQHRRGEIPGFTQRYNINRLVYYEQFNDVRDAISREKQIKGWSRSKKEALISIKNSKWTDLATIILGLGNAPRSRWQEHKGWRNEDSSLPPSLEELWRTSRSE